MLDIFSGIGGFSYAAQQVWKDDLEIVGFCECDKFCQKVLRKHWPNVEIVENVRSERIKQFRNIDLLSAGVPCQPASTAGSQRGTSDKRWLWPDTLEIIRLVRPHYAILENVPGLFSLEQGLAFNGILSGLAEIGYDCWWETIPACAVGAPHKRDRIWIVAYRYDKWELQPQRGEQKQWGRIGNTGCDIADTSFAGKMSSQQSGQGNGFKCENSDVADSNSQGLQIGESKRNNDESKCETIIRNIWSENWYEVAARFCRVDDGIPTKLDETIRRLTKCNEKMASDRVNRLKSLGNAIVPQVAMIIMQAIKDNQ
jgi:DNA (cytosine-5)-methyltransferase 1